ncbi:MAG: sigma-70 family RNA polymerase sigma factor [Cyanobacteria bacterium P01_A01_bin.116]
MRSRHDVTEIFSTYIRFDADRFAGWLLDSRLQRSMKKTAGLAAIEQASKNVWALYWHKQWQSGPNHLAAMHLLAYLQEAGYWAAHSYADRFQHKTQEFALSDCFQVATAKLQSVLEQFQLARGTTLESFAKRFFKSTIANQLRLANAINVCSDWSFLRRLTKVKLTETLENRALSPHEIEQYLLVWKCFKRLYAPQRQQGISRLTKPAPETLSAIAALYNKERTSQLTATASTIDEATVSQWLDNCIQWGRQYLYPTVGSLDVPKPGYSSGNLQDDLPGDQVVSLVEGLIATEALHQRQQQQQQLGMAMNEAIKTLKEPGETLLQLSYQQSLKQREIADRLGIKQYAVCRKLNKARSDLLKSLLQWSQNVLNVTPTPERIEHMEILIEEWLEEQYANQ